MSEPRRRSLLAVVGPGLLVAATGVGAGDLATGAFTGSELGTAILWAVVAGAGIKYVLSEGLTRWQLVTGTTILEGACTKLGPVVRYGFLVYLLIWTFGVAAALMSACGVAAHALVPLFDPVTDKRIYGLLHSLVAIALVIVGGYRLLEKVMSVCIAVMFLTVISTAIAIGPAWGEILSGILVPRIPHWDGQGIEWTVALLGGVGGTLTIISYGYWIREENREAVDELPTCRWDLATGYGMTALFGMAMVVIGAISRPEKGNRGSAAFVVEVARHIGESPQLGTFAPVAEWAFLIGAWCAVFSSLFGVWQCTPYFFADFWRIASNDPQAPPVDTSSRTYRGYLIAMGTIPAVGLFVDFKFVQKWNAVWGALVIPLLALFLLILNGRGKWVGDEHRNKIVTTLLLTAAVAVFAVFLALGIQKRLAG